MLSTKKNQFCKHFNSSNSTYILHYSYSYLTSPFLSQCVLSAFFFLTTFCKFFADCALLMKISGMLFVIFINVRLTFCVAVCDWKSLRVNLRHANGLYMTFCAESRGTCRDGCSGWHHSFYCRGHCEFWCSTRSPTFITTSTKCSALPAASVTPASSTAGAILRCPTTTRSFRATRKR